MVATRIFVSISQKSQHWSQVCESVENAVTIALDLVKQKGFVAHNVDTPRLLVEDKLGSRIHVVFDVDHDTYRPEVAHLPGQGNLPVIAVWFSKIDSAQLAPQGIRDKVNSEVRQWHTLKDANATPPFVFDRSKGACPTFVIHNH